MRLDFDEAVFLRPDINRTTFLAGCYARGQIAEFVDE
jgi:hypothetical protein